MEIEGDFKGIFDDLPSAKLISMENHHVEWENQLFLWPCSIAMLASPEGSYKYKILWL